MFSRQNDQTVGEVSRRRSVHNSVSQASRVYLPQMAIHTATGEASHVYSISVFTFHMKVSIHTASLEIFHVHRVRPVTGLMAPRKQHLVVYSQRLDGCSVISMAVCDDLLSVNST